MAETKRVIYYDQLSGNQPTNGDVIFVDNPNTGTHKMDLKSFVDAINNGFDSSIKSSGVSVSADNYSSIITNVNDQPVNSVYTYGAGLQSKVSNLPSNKAMTIINFAQKSTGGLGQVMLAIERNGSDDYLYFRTIGGSPAVWSSWVKVANSADVEAVREALDNLDIETDKTLSIADKPADAKAAGDAIDDLKADFSDLTSSAYLRVIDLQKVDGKYIGTNGNILYYTGMCYAVLPVSVGDILVLTTNPSGNINAISYSATETLSSPLERVVLGTGNTVQTYTWNVDKNGYAVVSGTTESVSVKISRKYLRNQAEYEIYIAGSNSAHKAEADFVCSGENDDEIINKALAIPSVKSVYFYSDSIFSISAPIILRSGQTIKSNGAVFTQPAMVATELTSANVDVTDHLLRVSSVEGFKAGQYVYIQDDNGQNMYNIIASVYSAGNSSITFVNQIDYQWTPEYNTVIKTANPCFVLDHVNNVTIDGVHIDWNVAENPIQTYNPYFLQEGVSIQYSNNVTVKSCKIENGGRRGICTTDSLNITIDNCFLKNWHEHAIDIFSGYTDLENPALSNVIITDTIVTDNKMHGIQMHRGSGVIVTNCIAYNNVEANISMAEYAHHNVVSNCLCDTSKVGIIARTGSHDNLIKGNQVLNCNNIGIWIRGTANYNTKHNTVVGNQIDNAVITGILAEFADRVSIINNKMRRISSDMTVGVPIQASLCHYAVIKSNEIERSEAAATYGIRVAGGTSDYNIINDNIIYNCGAPSYTGQHDVATGNVVMTIA